MVVRRAADGRLKDIFGLYHQTEKEEIMPGPTATHITLTTSDRGSSGAVVRARKSEPRVVKRATIVLQAASGASNIAIAIAVGLCRWTVQTWRDWFAASCLDGMVDKPRSGRSPTYTAADQTVVQTIA